MISLETDDVKLRRLKGSDAETLAALINNKKIWDNLRDALPFPYTFQDAVNFIEICEQEEPVVTFAIEYRGDFAGVIGLVRQHDVYRLSAELGFWLGEPFWNKGIATKATKLIVKYGFEYLDLIRIYSCVFEFNSASRKVLEKTGFTLDAIFKNAVIKNDKIANECRYSFIK